MANGIDRRAFLKFGAISVTGIAQATASSALTAAHDPVVKQYVPLGKTGLRMSDISFGSSQIRRGQEDLVRHALARGVNYFDTAEGYAGGASEPVLGNALKADRDKVIIATKTKAYASSSAEELMTSLERSLARLKTDYIDIYFNHAVNSLDRLQNPEWFEFARKAKQQGKIRFTGMSGHAGNLADCVDYAVEHHLFDVLLLAQNFGQDPAFYEKFVRSFDWVAKQPRLPEAMKKAKEKGIGIIGMKVLRGAKLNDMRPFENTGATYAQAAFKWTLSQPYVDAAIISMTSKTNIDEFLGASGQRQVTDTDFKLLEQYARLTDLTYCRHACNDCEGSCPYNVEIADVLRTRMYAVDYGNLTFAKSEYAQIESNANACLSCDGKPCQDACTHGISISSYCGPTHIMMS
jgi:predicted aldo/keto reductase-like oxidoreductase